MLTNNCSYRYLSDVNVFNSEFEKCLKHLHESLIFFEMYIKIPFRWRMFSLQTKRFCCGSPLKPQTFETIGLLFSKHGLNLFLIES